jgi:hypothetical protein
VKHEGVGVLVATCPDGPRNGGRDAASNAAGRHHRHQHPDRKDEGDPDKGVRAEKSDVVGLCDANQSLSDEDADRRQSQAHQRWQDGALKHRRASAKPSLVRALQV